MASTTDAILLDNGTQIVDLHNVPPPSQYSYKDIESIQDNIDNLIKDLSSDWKGSIPFCCHVIDNNDQDSEFISKSTGTLLFLKVVHLYVKSREEYWYSRWI